MKKFLFVCGLMLCVLVAACSKSSDASSTEDEKSFDAKAVAEKIEKEQKLSNDELVGCAEYIANMMKEAEKAEKAGNYNEEKFLKEHPGTETIARFLSNPGNWMDYDTETILKVGKAMGIDINDATSASSSFDSDFEEVDFENIDIEPGEAAVPEYDYTEALDYVESYGD